ncbi:MAG TPA: hypothetical protein VKW06_22435 [Candidatus Angelobacter sp.]|nr:hypothetical protein [Candidatus Angelobacter sp.]
MGRKLLAGILGGLAFFAWSSIAHMATGLGETGFQEIPNEQAVLGAMKASIPNDGLYFFPGTGVPNPTHADRMAAMQKKAEQHYVGPQGILIYHPAKPMALDMGQLGKELATNIVQVLLVVFLLAQTSLTSFAARWRFATAAGVLAAISTNVSYWTFYGFPTSYTLATICSIAMGFVCAGLVVAAMVKPAAGASSARRAAA